MKELVKTLKQLCILIVIGFSITACSDDPAPTVTTGATSKNTAKNTDANDTQENSMYDFQAWQKKGVAAQTTNSATIFSVVGLEVKQNDSVLDYMGNEAVRFKLRGDEVAFFNLIDSNGFVEITWYRGSNNSTKETKAKGIENTEKAYQVARVMFGEKGAKIVEDILTSEDGITRTRHSDLVFANCEAFMCRIVASKSAASKSNKPNTTTPTSVGNTDVNEKAALELTKAGHKADRLLTA